MARKKIKRKPENVPIPVIDPTENVMSLVSASNLRQDDLRNMAAKYQEVIDALRDQHHRELGAAESKRIDAVILAESRRVDAIMSASANNVLLASEKAAAQAATLAAQVAANAEALRTQVAATATTTQQSITTLANSLGDRIKVVEQNQYQAGGAKTQQTEGQTSNRWAIQVTVTIILFVLAFMLARMWPVH